ncbi:MAG: phosphoribosylanthranilate isomerase [Woeseiaceae bacterium]
MRPFVKICGLTEREHIDAAIEFGVDAIGFVFVKSVRQISIEKALEISEGITNKIKRVAVFLDPEESHWNDVLSLNLNLTQFRAMRAIFCSLRVPSSIEKWPVLREHQSNLMIPKKGKFIYEGKHSGVGERVDWSKAAKFSKQGDLILAGGLSHANVKKAINTVKPFGVDVSSAVESSPGKKSLSLIEKFIREC